MGMVSSTDSAGLGQHFSNLSVFKQYKRPFIFNSALEIELFNVHDLAHFYYTYELPILLIPTPFEHQTSSLVIVQYHISGDI